MTDPLLQTSGKGGLLASRTAGIAIHLGLPAWGFACCFSFYSSCFMLLYGIVWVSLILSYLTEVRRTDVIGDDPTAAAASGRPLLATGESHG